MTGAQVYEQNGRVVLTTPFDFRGVEQALGEFEPETDLATLSPAELEAAIQGVRMLVEWVWQDGPRNKDGMAIRAGVVAWVLLPHVRSLTESELACGFGLHKQSIERWVHDFKRCFPNLRLSHMRWKQKPHSNGKAKPRSSWPAFIVAQKRLARFKAIMERAPISKWPSANLERMRADLSPLMAMLEGYSPGMKASRINSQETGYRQRMRQP